MIGQLVIIAVLILGLDAAWLSYLFKSFNKMIVSIQGTPISLRLVPTVIAYILIIGSVWYFAVNPSKNYKDAALRGALLGLGVYGIYESTNYAILKNYSSSIALMDTLWGTFLFSVSAAITKLLRPY